MANDVRQQTQELAERSQQQLEEEERQAEAMGPIGSQGYSLHSQHSQSNRVGLTNSMEHMNDSSIDIIARQKLNMLRTSLQRFEVQTPNLLSLFFVCLFRLTHADPYMCETLKLWCMVTGKDGRGIGVQGLGMIETTPVKGQKMSEIGALFECRQSTFLGPGSCLGEKVQGATGWSLKMSESLTENSELCHFWIVSCHIRPRWTSNLKRKKLQQRSVKRRRHSTLWILVLNQKAQNVSHSQFHLSHQLFNFASAWISLEEPLREDWGLWLQAFAH